MYNVDGLHAQERAIRKAKYTRWTVAYVIGLGVGLLLRNREIAVVRLPSRLRDAGCVRRVAGRLGLGGVLPRELESV
jgi:hypothetical protein